MLLLRVSTTCIYVLLLVFASFAATAVAAAAEQACAAVETETREEAPKEECLSVEEEEEEESWNNTTTMDLPEYLVVGAGGSGIQMALLLQKYNYSYTILEKEQVAGSFWTRFPVFGELISVNKWTANEAERLRYDWHSMLEAPIQMFNITKDYFPQGMDWHRYMTRVVDLAGIRIEYGAEVASIVSDGRPCVVLVDGTERCAHRRVFVGTGLKEKEEALLRALGGVPYSKMTKELAEQRRVCIVGNGNAGFEVAQNTFNVADRVFVTGRHDFRLSSVTRYTGDVRVKFLQVLENFYGKLLDSVFTRYGNKGKRRVVPGFNEQQQMKFGDAKAALLFLRSRRCNVLVLATGFQSHVPGMDDDDMMMKDRFPPSNDWYASTDNPNVHYIGWLMHERDFRRGAGGFLSGYRVLIRNLVHWVRQADHGVEYPCDLLTAEEVVDRVVTRTHTSHELVILQDGVILRDAIVPSTAEKGMYYYYEGITFDFHRDISSRDDIIYFFFAWGNSRTASHVFDHLYYYEDARKLINAFLHPVIEVAGKQRHMVEDVDMTWTRKEFVAMVGEVVRSALAGDLSDFAAYTVRPYKRVQLNYTDSSEPYAKPNNGIELPNDGFVEKHLEAIKTAIRNPYSAEALDQVRVITRERFPDLFQMEGDTDVDAK